MQAVTTTQVGVAGMILGAGRKKLTDVIDHAVGITVKARLGDELQAGDPLAVLHYNDEDKANTAEPVLLSAFKLGDGAVTPPPLVYEVLR